MKKKLVFAILISLAFASASLAQDDGRPDPTGKGRYIEFGTEVTYAGATVLKELPAGASCGPANEMVGAKVWNSTREGKAILVELSDKAKTASTKSGEIYLCECAKGFNQLFLPKKAETAPAPAPAPKTEPPPATQPTAPQAMAVIPEVDQTVVLPVELTEDHPHTAAKTVGGATVGAGIVLGFASVICPAVLPAAVASGALGGGFLGWVSSKLHHHPSTSIQVIQQQAMTVPGAKVEQKVVSPQQR